MTLTTCQDMLDGGTDTTSATMEWAMTELFKTPTAMTNLQTEVREIVKDRHDITDDVQNAASES